MPSAPPFADLAGREPETAALDELLRAAAEGATRAAAVVGEAGIGKSALLESVRDAAVARDLLVLDGRAAEHERDVPFGLVIDAFDDVVETLHARRLEALGIDRLAALADVLPAVARHADRAPGAGSELGRPTDRFHAHRALRALLDHVAGSRPLVLALDDLHWADPASIELVSHLLRRPPSAGSLLVLAFRPVPAMAPVLDALRSAAHARELRLRPLGRPAALAVLGEVADPRLRERLADEAGGNPLFLQALGRAARETPAGGLPHGIVAAVARETAAIAPAARTLLEGAAVAGDPFDPELAAAAAGVDPRDAPALLDSLVAADLVRPTSGPRGFAFRHPLVRRAVYDAAAPGWRLGAHERAAAALAARAAPNAARAYHVAQCARPGDRAAIAVLRAAGEDARGVAPAAAARWFGAARRLVGEDDPQAAADLDYSHGMALGADGRMSDAARLVTAVLDRGVLPSGVELGRLTEEASGFIAMSGRMDEARARNLAALASVPSGEDRARLLMAVAALSFPPGAEARELAAEALAVLGDARTPLVAYAHGIHALASFLLGDLARADAHGASAAGMLEAMPDAVVARRFGAILAVSALHAEREHLRAAEEALARAHRVAAVTAQGHWTSMLANWRVPVLLELGRIQEAGEVAGEAEDAVRLGGQAGALAIVRGHQAVCLDVADRTVEARAAAQEALRLAGSMEQHFLVRATRARLAALGAEADPERALADMTQAAGPDLAVAGSATAVALQQVAVRAALALGRVAEAQARARAMADVATRLELPLARARAASAAAEVLLAQADAHAGAQRAREALSAAKAAGGVLEAIRARTVLASCLAATGDAVAAEIALREASADAERVGALRWRAAAARQLRRLGHRVPVNQRHPPGADGLSSREREIAQLVAAGRSNKQVGAALHLSEKTIENNLSRIYAKLGVRSRVELATAVATRRDAAGPA